MLLTAFKGKTQAIIYAIMRIITAFNILRKTGSIQR